MCAERYVRDALICQIGCLVACLLKNWKNGEEKENGETLMSGSFPSPRQTNRCFGHFYTNL